MLAIVCGMSTEQTILNNPPGALIIQGRWADTMIEADLETAIAAGGIKGVLSFGVAGGLAPDLVAGAIVVGSVVTDGVTKIRCHSDWRINLYAALCAPGFLKPFRPAAFGYSTGIVATAAAKAALFAAQGADVVDMETWPAAQVAARHGLPFAALRTVSDPYNLDDAPATMVAMAPSGAIDVAAVVGSLASDPGQIGGLVTLGSDAGIAFGNLAAALLQIGMGFGFPQGDF